MCYLWKSVLFNNSYKLSLSLHNLAVYIFLSWSAWAQPGVCRPVNISCHCLPMPWPTSLATGKVTLGEGREGGGRGEQVSSPGWTHLACHQAPKVGKVTGCNKLDPVIRATAANHRKSGGSKRLKSSVCSVTEVSAMLRWKLQYLTLYGQTHMSYI